MSQRSWGDSNSWVNENADTQLAEVLGTDNAYELSIKYQYSAHKLWSTINLPFLQHVSILFGHNQQDYKQLEREVISCYIKLLLN
jgi:hypothetical protein